MNQIAKTFIEILKFNPWHDRIGRFTSGGGGGAMFSANPNTKSGLAAIKRAQKDNPLIGAQYGTKSTPGQIKARKMSAGSKAVAGHILEMNNIPSSRTNVKLISDFYKKVDTENTIRYDESKNKLTVKRRAMEAAKDTAKEILKDYEVKVDNPDYKELRDYVRNTPVKISNYDKGDIADYGSYLKDNFGSVKISNKGLPIDSFYQELSDKFPHLFDSNKQSNPSDQLKKVNETLKSMKNNSSRKLSRSEMEEYADYMSKDIIKYYAARVSS